MRTGRKTGRRLGRRTGSLVLVFLFLALLGAACSEEEPLPTAADRLAELEGRELSPAEVAEQQEVFEMVCNLDDRVLTTMWADMDEHQLAIQDIAFGITCPDRNSLYAERTGRFTVTE